MDDETLEQALAILVRNARAAAAAQQALSRPGTRPGAASAQSARR